MKIMFLNQAPRKGDKGPAYEVGEITRLLNSYASAGTTVEIGFPDDYEGAEVARSLGAQSHLNGLHHMMEVPSIVRKIFWAAQNGYDAVIQSNTFDPGVDGGRLAVDIPGHRPSAYSHACGADACRSRWHHGAARPACPYTRRILRTYGLEHFVSDIKPIGVYQNVKQRKAEIFDITVKLIRALVDETGAEIILPLGGALIPYVVDPAELAAATGVQVLNTKAIGIRFAETCVTFKMAQSAITYPRAQLNYADFTKRL